jgi:hypothetical protein
VLRRLLAETAATPGLNGYRGIGEIWGKREVVLEKQRHKNVLQDIFIIHFRPHHGTELTAGSDRSIILTVIYLRGISSQS